MFQNQVHRSPTDAELALLKAEASKLCYSLDSPQQVADKLNAPRQIENPIPCGRVPKTTFLKSEVQKVLTGLIIGLLRGASPLLPAYQYIQAQVNAYSGDVYTLEEMQVYVQEFLVDGILTRAAVDLLVSDPDPAYRPLIEAGSLAIQMFGTILAVEGSDITAALAS